MPSLKIIDWFKSVNRNHIAVLKGVLFKLNLTLIFLLK